MHAPSVSERQYEFTMAVTNESEGRERVLREAHALFIERGFAEVSMQQIADAAGMTKASLYYHFKDKEDLFAHVVQHEGQRIIHGVTAELDGVEGFHEQLRRVVLHFFKAIRSDIGRLMTDFHRHVSAERHQQMHRAFDADTFDPIGVLRPYFQRAQATGEMRPGDTDFAIMLFFAMVGGCSKFAEQSPERIQLGEEQAEQIVEVFLHGVGAPGRNGYAEVAEKPRVEVAQRAPV
jgi:TetR/AcrR family transcriptional regulator, mexJK operon transcriptional repressor